jgi:hypothetical protein
MKIFKKYDRQEGEIYVSNVALGVGRLTYIGELHNTSVNEMGCQVDECHKVLMRNGGFIRFELPFAKTITYTCPREFVEKTGKCRPTWLLSWRKPFRNGRPSDDTHFVKTFVWLPRN